MFNIQVTKEVEVFEFIEYYSEEGLEMVIYQCHWGRLCTFTAQVSQEREFFKLIE